MLPFQVVDSHLHFWDPKQFKYPWLSDVPSISGTHGTNEFDLARNDVMVEKIVFVQADCAPEHAEDEVEWIETIAESDSRIGAIVAFAPLEDGASVAQRLKALSDRPLVKGVRRILQDESLDFFESATLREGIRLLPEYDLTFDLCVRHHQLDATFKLVSSCPEVTFILDHAGKPDIKGRILDSWKESMKSLSALPNVQVKLSGLVTEADHENWKPFKLKPFIDHVVASFGFDRVLFGSDWPVMSQASGYGPWIEALLWSVEGCRESEMMRLFRNNAKAVYRLDI